MPFAIEKHTAKVTETIRNAMTIYNSHTANAHCFCNRRAGNLSHRNYQRFLFYSDTQTTASLRHKTRLARETSIPQDVRDRHRPTGNARSQGTYNANLHHIRRRKWAEPYSECASKRNLQHKPAPYKTWEVGRALQRMRVQKELTTQTCTL